jgi:hypothetical protein
VRLYLLALLAACSGSSGSPAGGGGGGGEPGVDAAPAGEVQPDPAPGNGVADPAQSTLHDHGCAGTDWQLLGGWLLTNHSGPAIGDAAELDRCVQRYAGWVTNDADGANVSRAMVYAALAATGKCDEAAPAATGADIADLVQTIGNGHDPVLVAAKVATGAAATCGGSDHWKIVAPAGFIDHFTGAYNAVIARTKTPPQCTKHITVTVALYTGMATPDNANGCWTVEHVAKSNDEYKICNFDGTVHNPMGVKWVYDDTNTLNNATTEANRITSCASGTPAGGYIYMANRGAGWRSVTSTDVRAHFAELYSDQSTVDDQFAQWKSAGKPGQPMVNFGEAATTAATISTVTKTTCAEVGDKKWWGLYVYPTSLDGTRLDAMVKALNACTE